MKKREIQVTITLIMLTRSSDRNSNLSRYTGCIDLQTPIAAAPIAKDSNLLIDLSVKSYQSYLFQRQSKRSIQIEPYIHIY